VPVRHNGVVEEESLTLVLDGTEWSGSCTEWFGPEEGNPHPHCPLNRRLGAVLWTF